MGQSSPAFIAARRNNSCGFVFRLGFSLFLALVLASAGLAARPSPAVAAAIQVVNTNDSGPGSLRAAVASASSGDVITFNLAAPATITLNSQLTVAKNLTIIGLGPSQLSLSGGGATRIFWVGAGGALRISQMTLKNGFSKGQNATGGTPGAFNGQGGAVFVAAGAEFVAEQVTFQNNSAWGGSGANAITETGAGGGAGGAPAQAGQFGGGGGGGGGGFPDQGGSGGFGGGGGGSDNYVSGGSGGTYGGKGGSYGAAGMSAGGGGAGLGGAIFIDSGGSVGLRGVSLLNNSVTGGSGGTANPDYMGGGGGGGGAGLGSAIFNNGGFCAFSLTASGNSATGGLAGGGKNPFAIYGVTLVEAENGQEVDTTPGMFDLSAVENCGVFYITPTNLSLSSSTLPENQPSGTLVGAFSTTDPDVGDSFTYSLVSGAGSTDNASFQIIADKLYTSAPLDYEARPGYSIRARTTDAGGRFLEKVFPITVQNVNDPITNITLSGNSIAENKPANTEIGALGAVDQDGQPHTFTLVNPGGGCDGSQNGLFSISAGVLYSQASFNFEATSSYTICVRASDSGAPAQSLDKQFTIQVENANEAPVNLALSNDAIPENELAGVTIGSLSASDPDAGQSLQFSLASSGPSCSGPDNAKFSVAGALLQAGQSFDFESGSSYSICVRVTDDGATPASTDAAFTIKIQDVNEAPSGLALSKTSVSEQLEIGTEVGMFIASDPDAGQTLEFSLVNPGGSCDGSDNGSFSLSNGRLYTNQVFDFNIRTSYTICARVQDDGDGRLYQDQQITITITDVNQAPTDILLSETKVLENQPIGTPVGSLTAADPDGGQTHTFTLVAGGAGCPGVGNASFTIAGNQLRSAYSFDYEVQNSYSICVRTTDNGTPALHFDQAFTIAVQDVNEKPFAIGLSPSSLPENQPVGTVIGGLSASDSDAGQAISFSLVEGVAGCDGADNAAFTLVGSQLYSAQSFNFEGKSSYAICVRASDDGSPVAAQEQALIVTVTDLNEAPTTIQLTPSSLAENLPSGSLVGSLSAADPDGGQTHTFTLVDLGAGCSGTDNASFSIADSQVYSAHSFDYESQNSYSICVRAEDSGSPSLKREQAFTIAVTNLNEKPDLDHLLPDQTTIAGQLYQYSLAVDAFSDPDGEPLAYSAALQSGDPLPAWLAFDPAARVFSGTPLQTQVIEITVTASDAAGETAADTFRLEVVAQAGNHAPVLVFALPNQAGQVGQPFQFTFQAGHFADYDGDPLTYLANFSDGGALPAWLAFQSDGRAFSGIPDAAGTLIIAVTALDGRGGQVTTTFVLAIDQNAAPTLLRPIPDQAAALGLPWSFQVDLATFSDANGDELTYSASLSGGSPLPAWLTFDPAARVFSGTPPASAGLIWYLQVNAQDSSGSAASDVFALSPWSSPASSGLPDGVALAFRDPGSSGPDQLPKKSVDRFNRTAGLSLTYGSQPVSGFTDASLTVCFELGSLERLRVQGDLKRLVIAKVQDGVWWPLSTQVVGRSQVCATSAPADLYEVFVLPAAPTPSTDPTTAGASGLPGTGFAPGRVTPLAVQPAQRSYTDLGSVWLEIPASGLKAPILGVPLQDGNWDVSWLAGKIGWLEGSAFPGLNGNSVLTGHVYDANGQPGPFQRLSDLRWGQQIVVHAFGETYTYEVRTLDLAVLPSDLQPLRHEDLPWLTLITCQGYDPHTGMYRSRTVLRAVLVKTAGQ